MEDWKKIRLGDIVEVASGFSYKGEYIGSGRSILLGMGCVSFKEKFLMSGARPYSGESPDRFHAQPGDIVLATRQQSENLPILGMPAILPDSLSGHDVIVGANLYRIINNSEIENRFLYLQLKTPHYLDHINKCKTGTTVRMITKKNIEDYVFLCPPKEVREKIVSMLWNIEDKIDLNKRINHNLEQQAQALYKSWFVDFEPFRDGKFVESELGMIPEGWRVGTLSEISSITMGQSPSGTSFNEVGDGIVFYQGRTEFGNRFPSIRLYTTEPARFAEKFSVLLSVRAPVGDINIAKEKCCIGRGLASIHGLFQSFVYYTVGSLKPVLNRFNGEGTVFGSINRKELEGLKIIVPPVIIQEDFNCIVSKYDRDIYDRCSENETLCQLRDKILPKLMSGELKISDLTC